MTVAAGGEAGELHDAGRGESEPVGEPQQVAGQGLIRQRVQAARKRVQLVHRLFLLAGSGAGSPGRGRRRRCCGRACPWRCPWRLTGGSGRDGGDLARLGVAAACVGEAERDVVQEGVAEALGPGVDGFAAAVFDQPLQQADDAVGAAVEVFGHGAAGEHAGVGVHQPQLLLDPGQVPGPGGDLGRGVVTEPVQLNQVEPPLGLGGLQDVDTSVRGRREGPLAGARVVAALAQQPGAGDVHADEHEGDVHAHERADQVQHVLVIGAARSG